MDYFAQVQRGIDYIETNLEFDIQSSDVARHAGISHWHFQRIFKALANETLKTYIRSRRFSRSLDKLSGTKERVLDIAVAAGFESQESFTRAFRKAFGITPAHFRKHPSAVAFPRKVRFDAEYLSHIHTSVSLEPEIFMQPEMQMVGMHTRLFGVDLPHRIPGSGYGVVQQTPERSDELEYWAAVSVTRVESLPGGLASLRVPAARYARFRHSGHVAGLDRTVNYVYSSWLLRSGMRHTYGCDLELYGDEYQPDSEQSVIYYAIPVEA